MDPLDDEREERSTEGPRTRRPRRRLRRRPLPRKRASILGRRGRERGGKPRASTRMSPTFRRVMKVEDIPARSRSKRNSRRLARGPTATISSAPFSCARRIAMSSLRPGAGMTADGNPRRSTRSRPELRRSGRRAPRAQLRPQRFVGNRIHVSDDQVRRVAGLEQPVCASVHADQDRPELANVGPYGAQVALGLGARATTSAWRSRKLVRSCGSSIASVRTFDSSRRC